MAKPTLHSALEGAGFKLQGSEFNGSSDRVGTAMTHHYVLTKNHGNDVRPIAHHVYVDEFSRSPGKYNVSYHVTRHGSQYSDGDFDTMRRHRDNSPGGVRDPIGDILGHHEAVSNVLRNRAPRANLKPVTRDNVHSLAPGSFDHEYHKLVSYNSVQQDEDSSP